LLTLMRDSPARRRNGAAAARALLLLPHRRENPAALSRSGTEAQRGRASMKHPSNRELFDYWNALRRRRPAPERGEIEPTAIRRVLADTFILTFDEPAAHPFRIAGTRVCALFNRELKGEGFLPLWEGGSRNLLRDLIANVTDETVGMVAGVS